ncbi:MAG: hypothetical protein K0U64_04875, partial [Actinomycetia bacterium]|nr:hypothetical protein [Actinomycetes bacterium]
MPRSVDTAPASGAAEGQWRPSGPVILLQTKANQIDVDSVRDALPDTEVRVLRMRVQVPAKTTPKRVLRRVQNLGPRKIHTRVQGAQRLIAELDKDPSVTSVLALDPMSQRVAREALKSRPDVIGFGRIDYLSRAITGGLTVSLTSQAARLVDYRHTYEAIAGAAETQDPGDASAAVALLLGANHLNQTTALGVAIEQAGL